MKDLKLSLKDPMEIWQDQYSRDQLWGKLRALEIKECHDISVAIPSSKLQVLHCDAPKPGGPLTTRQPAEYKWMSGYPTPL